MAGALIERGDLDTDKHRGKMMCIHTGRRPYEDGDGSDASTSQGLLKISGKPPDVRKKEGRVPYMFQKETGSQTTGFQASDF